MRAVVAVEGVGLEKRKPMKAVVTIKEACRQEEIRGKL